MSCLGQDFLVREMKIEDIKKVVEIENNSFPTPWSSYAFACEILENSFANYLVITHAESNKLIAYGGMWVIIDEAHITNIAVHSDFRGKGFGKILLLNLMKQALIKGAERMTLEVRASNETAKNLYSNLGFKEAGIRKGYYLDTKEDAIIMWMDLLDSCADI